MKRQGRVITIGGASNCDVWTVLGVFSGGCSMQGVNLLEIVNSSPIEFVRQLLDTREPEIVLILEPWPALREALPALSAEHPHALFILTLVEGDLEEARR